MKELDTNHKKMMSLIEEIETGKRLFKPMITDFERRLIELNLTYAQIELVKQAVHEFIISIPHIGRE